MLVGLYNLIQAITSIYQGYHLVSYGLLGVLSYKSNDFEFMIEQYL